MVSPPERSRPPNSVPGSALGIEPVASRTTVVRAARETTSGTNTVASLSAILLDDAYYEFILAGRRELDGLPWVGEDRLIPLKASAWLDLGERQAKGENVIAAFLPELAKDSALGKVSGWGWSFGYIGGILSLGISFAYVVFAQGQGQTAEQYVPVTMLITAAIFALASLPTFLILKETLEKHGFTGGEVGDAPIIRGSALAAMEGRFESGPYAELNLIGQPNVPEGKIDNPIRLPGLLSFIAYGSFSAEVKGLNDFPRDQWPTSIELLYYGFHIMVGLGTFFILLMGLSSLQLWRRKLEQTRILLWVLAFAFPFPFIANTAGWMTAELGRQPWLIYGLMRTSEGTSHLVHGGQTVFTLIGFAGIYFVLGVLYLYLMIREVAHGPASHGAAH